jgi:hypothetical protein
VKTQDRRIPGREGRSFITNTGRFYSVYAADSPETLLGNIRFQDGPVPEAGPNGLFVEDLLRVAMDRLEGYQRDFLACPENAEALDAIREALKSLDGRTRDRELRGVLGSMEE